MHTTSNLKDGYLGSGTMLRRSIRKHGKENFKCEILEYYNNKGELIIREKELITQELLNDSLCMNLKLGGVGGFSVEEAKLGREASNKILKKKYGENFRQIINKKFREDLKNNPVKRLIYTSKIKEGQIRSKHKHHGFKNKKHTEETKLKQSLAKRGKYSKENHPQYGTCWVTKEGINKKIKKEELENYLSLDWNKGRVVKSGEN